MKRTYIFLVTLFVTMFVMAYDASAWESYVTVRLSASANVSETKNSERVRGYVSTTQDATPDESKFQTLGKDDVKFTLTWSGDWKNLTQEFTSKNIYVYIKYEKSDPAEYKFTKIVQYKGSKDNPVVEHEHSATQSAIQCIQATVKPTTKTVQEAETVGFYHKFEAIVIPRGVVAVNYDDRNISDSRPSVSYSPEYNYIGDNVTLKATMPRYTDGHGNTYDNPHYAFEGWYDGDSLVSELPEFSMTADKERQNLTARYSFKPGFIGKGYYRIRTARNGSREYIKVVGNVGGDNTLAAQRFTTANLVLSGDGISDYPYIESDPATIFYFDGTMDTASASDAKNLSSGKQFSTDAVLTSQGASTTTMFDAFGGKIEIASGCYAGSIALRPVGSDKWLTRVGDADKIYGGLAIDGNLNDLDATFELEPVNEENYNDYYLGVAPDEKTLYDDGYWTTMYTSFPYICTSSVEPYYLKVTDAQCNYELKRVTIMLEGDNRIVVPANTAVLLKCAQTAANLNKLIPLAPDAAVAPIADNYMAGVFQLNKTIRSGNTDIEKAGLYNFSNNSRHEDYEQIDPLKYVFRCITDVDIQNLGKVRSREVAENPAYCPIAFDQPLSIDVLGPNNVYLDAQKIVDDYNVAPENLPKAFSIDPVAIPTGIKSVNGNAATPEYYNLQGLRVNRPATGGIYIVRVGQRMFKAVYRGA